MHAIALCWPRGQRAGMTACVVGGGGGVCSQIPFWCAPCLASSLHPCTCCGLLADSMSSMCWASHYVKQFVHAVVVTASPSPLPHVQTAPMFVPRPLLYTVEVCGGLVSSSTVTLISISDIPPYLPVNWTVGWLLKCLERVQQLFWWCAEGSLRVC